MKLKTFLLISTALIYTQKETYSISWGSLVNDATGFVNKNVLANNPQAQQQVEKYGSIISKNAGTLVSGAGSALQNTAQTFWNQNGQVIQKDFSSGNYSGILSQGETLAKNALNTGQTYAQQQQSVLTTDYANQYGFTQDQVTQTVQNLTALDAKFGLKVPQQIRVAYGQTQYSLIRTPIASTDEIKQLMALAQNQLTAVPTIANNQNLTPYDKTWQQLKDVNGNVYDLSGNPSAPATPYSNIQLISIPGVTFTDPTVTQTVVPTQSQTQTVVPTQSQTQTVVPTQSQTQTVVPTQSQTATQAAATLQALYTAYNQNSAKLSAAPFNPAILGSIMTAYNSLNSKYLANQNDPSLPSLIAAANKILNNLPTIINANGVLVPTADWNYLYNTTTQGYTPTN